MTNVAIIIYQCCDGPSDGDVWMLVVPKRIWRLVYTAVVVKRYAPYQWYEGNKISLLSILYTISGRSLL